MTLKAYLERYRDSKIPREVLKHAIATNDTEVAKVAISCCDRIPLHFLWRGTHAPEIIVAMLDTKRFANKTILTLLNMTVRLMVSNQCDYHEAIPVIVACLDRAKITVDNVPRIFSLQTDPIFEEIVNKITWTKPLQKAAIPSIVTSEGLAAMRPHLTEFQDFLVRVDQGTLTEMDLVPFSSGFTPMWCVASEFWYPHAKRIYPVPVQLKMAADWEMHQFPRKMVIHSAAGGVQMWQRILDQCVGNGAMVNNVLKDYDFYRHASSIIEAKWQGNDIINYLRGTKIVLP